MGLDTDRVKILNINGNAAAIISAAGRISTTQGSANSIYDKSLGNDAKANHRLIKKIIASGHHSVLEHVNINLSFNNVSVFAEQFMIEFRLASFTVKSRRYVDFGNMGYHIPHFKGVPDKETAYDIYNGHMRFLFGAYDELLKRGVPKEDARFVLPYSFKSNFYCTVNARELLHIIDEMLFGRGRKYDEIYEIGILLKDKLIYEMPYLEDVINSFEKSPDHADDFVLKKPEERKIDLVTIHGITNRPEELLCGSYAANHSIKGIDVRDCSNQEKVIQNIMQSKRKREFEQVNVTFSFNEMSLAGITHMVRHRMQSVIIPEYVSACSHDRFVKPESIQTSGVLKEYCAVFEKTKAVCDKLSDMGMDKYESVYLFLSGMTVSVMTTMNVNELYTFFRLRTCNRAQWEIKRYADRLLYELRKEHPPLFSKLGPSCFCLGRCPEGRMTCGKTAEVIKKYGTNQFTEE